MKFKNYQPKIIGYTTLTTIALSILTILGYILIFTMSTSSNTYEIKDTAPKGEVQEEIDNFSDISEKDNIIPDTAGETYY